MDSENPVSPFIRNHLDHPSCISNYPSLRDLVETQDLAIALIPFSNCFGVCEADSCKLRVGKDGSRDGINVDLSVTVSWGIFSCNRSLPCGKAFKHWLSSDITSSKYVWNIGTHLIIHDYSSRIGGVLLSLDPDFLKA